MNKHPVHIEAERLLLGCALMDPVVIVDAQEQIRPSDFFHSGHGYLWALLVDRQSKGRGTDLASMASDLSDQEQNGISPDKHKSALAYICDLHEHAPAVLSWRHYAELVRDRSKRREVLAIAERAIEDMRDPSVLFSEGMARVETDLVCARETALGEDAEDPVESFMLDLDGRCVRHASNDGLTGLSWGIPALDAVTGGLQRGEFVGLVARPRVGKTALAIQAATAIASARAARVLFFSLEMNADRLLQRVMSIRTGIPYSAMRRGDLRQWQWDDIVAQQEWLRGVCEWMSVITTCRSMAAIRSRVLREHAQAPVGLVVVDYLQLLEGDPRASRFDQVTASSRGLKHLTNEVGACVLSVISVNRKSEDRPAGRISLGDMGLSGAIEYDLDMAIALERPCEDGAVEEDAVARLIKARDDQGVPAPLRFRRGLFYNRED